VILRPGRDDDATAFIDLIAAAWAEYPGAQMDVDGENPELRALATHFAQAGGALWAAEDAGRLLGMVATRPHGRSWELCRMYVAPDQRGTGLAATLLRKAEDHARNHGAIRMELWSDTLFDRAHRFYERNAYIRAGGIRPLADAAGTLEFGYAKPLTGIVVQRLDVAAAASAARSLGRILQECVAGGASVSFLPPLALTTAQDVYKSCATGIAKNERILLVAWETGQLAGSVMLDLATPPNQPHRAEVQKLLVAPFARRRGVARALMQAAEHEARTIGRSLLTLDTRAGDAAEQLYRADLWVEAGRIPGFARNADGSLGDTILFYKQLGLGA
jgi:GNAT superfamily N-acetyltransferase